jgi:hypothetical protein
MIFENLITYRRTLGCGEGIITADEMSCKSSIFINRRKCDNGVKKDAAEDCGGKSIANTLLLCNSSRFHT